MAIVHRLATARRFAWFPLPDRFDRGTEDVLVGDDRGVLEALRRLPRRQRIALWLHYGEDLSVVDVTTSLETSVPAAKQLLQRGREALQKEIARD